MNKSLQEIVYPEGVCFGCGPANAHGLHIKSYWDAEEKYVICDITPQDCFTAMPGVVYGGYLAMIVDCHSGWACRAAHYKAEGRVPGSLPRIHCVTGKLSLSYRKPTPMGASLHLKAWVEGPLGRKSRVLCEIYADGVLTVQADSLFVRVDPETFGR